MSGWLRPEPHGDRVRLRPPAPGDEPALIEMATDPRVRRYIGGPIDAATAAAKVGRKVTSPAWGEFVIVDQASARVAGSGSLARKRGPWELSFQLLHSYWGTGYAREAVELITGWFFANMPDDLLIATTQRANEASRRLLQRAGAVFAGTFAQYELPQERFEFRRQP